MAVAVPVSRKDVPRLIAAFDDHGLLTYASAIAFQILSALIPVMGVVLASLGLLHLESLWNDVANQLRPGMSPAAWSVLQDAVGRILHSGQTFWVTLGLVLTFWRLSGAVRAMMGAMDEVYGARRTRPIRALIARSVAISVVDALLVAAAVFVVRVVPLLVETAGALGVLLGVMRWSVAAGLLYTAVAVTIRYGANTPQPAPWVSFGAGLVVMCWLVLSALFGVYVTSVADYGSIMGSLSTLFVLCLYLYVAGVAWVAGIQIDAMVRKRASGSRSGS